METHDKNDSYVGRRDHSTVVAGSEEGRGRGWESGEAREQPETFCRDDRPAAPSREREHIAFLERGAGFMSHTRGVPQASSPKRGLRLRLNGCPGRVRKEAVPQSISLKKAGKGQGP